MATTLEMFEHHINKKFKHSLKQIDGAGNGMTPSQRKKAIQFLNSAYVGSTTIVPGELTWDRKGKETYHRPFWIAACEGDIVELAPAESTIIL